MNDRDEESLIDDESMQDPMDSVIFLFKTLGEDLSTEKQSISSATEALLQVIKKIEVSERSLNKSILNFDSKISEKKEGPASCIYEYKSSVTQYIKKILVVLIFFGLSAGFGAYIEYFLHRKEIVAGVHLIKAWGKLSGIERSKILDH